MPLQTSISKYPVRLPPGHSVTTQSQFRYTLQASESTQQSMIWDQAYQANYGMIYAWDNAAFKWALPTVALKDSIMGVCMWEGRYSDKTGYVAKDLLNLEIVGDRILVTAPGITIAINDPLHVIVNGAQAGKVTNVASATVGSETRRMEGVFTQAKISTDNNVSAIFNFLPRSVTAVGI
jgi:hypothetical protein